MLISFDYNLQIDYYFKQNVATVTFINYYILTLAQNCSLCHVTAEMAGGKQPGNH